MNKHAKAPFVLLALLSLLLVPLVAQAGDRGAKVQKASVSVMRGDHAMVSFGAEGPVSIELRGKLIDPKTDQPLARTGFEVVRFELDEGRSQAKVTVDEVTASAKEVISDETARLGDFKMLKLAPGRYSLQVAWDEVPADSDVVLWELRWVERPLSADSGSR